MLQYLVGCIVINSAFCC